MKTTDNPAKLRRLSMWGEGVSLTAFVLFVVALSVTAGMILLRPEFAARSFGEMFEVTLAAGDVGGGRLWLALLIWLLPDLVGVAMLAQIVRLFRGFRRDGVFTEQAGARLRRIGALLLILVPVGMVAQMLGSAWVTLSRGTGQGRVSLSLDDADIYALAIGLTILAVGHIMMEAVQIAEENKGFV